MRILHVANFSTRKYGADLYATDRKISAGLIRNGHFVYDFSYRDVCRNESLLRTTRFGRNRVNKKLVLTCDRLRPDLLLLGHSELIDGSTLAEIRKKYPAIKIGLWYVDPLFHRHNTVHLFARLDYLDVIFTTTGGAYLKEFCTPTTRAAFIPNVLDPAMECKKAFANNCYENDFIFCGRDSNDSERQEFIKKLYHETAKHLRASFRGCLGEPLITGCDYLDFLGQSKMALNISRRNDVTLYSSDRLVQLVGNGLLTFCPKVPSLELLFSGDELVYYHSFDDLLEKILYFHHNDKECRTIAQKGWNRAHSCYSVDRVTRYMIELLFDLPFTADYGWEEQIYVYS
ncbi:MAG: glycosyltransferase family protein [Desulforhopalus sp.]